MKYITLNNKEYLEDLVKERDVFVSVFEETLGYSLKKCIELGVDVPLDLVRSVDNYLKYPNIIDFLKSNQIEFNKDFIFTKDFIDGLASLKKGVEFDLLSSIVASCKKENIELDDLSTKIDFLNYLANAKNQKDLLKDYKTALNKEITMPVLEIIDVLNKDLIVKKAFAANISDDFTQYSAEFKI